jgi:S1-C subfamily serine protease
MCKWFAIKRLSSGFFFVLAAVSVTAQQSQMPSSIEGATPKRTGVGEPKTSQETYVVTEHNAVPKDDGTGLQDEIYTIVHGTNILKVRYAESQTNTAKPGESLGAELHLHSSYPNPDLSQIPEPGVIIRPCLMEKDSHGDPTIAKQPTPEPCMTRFGGILHYELSPNGPVVFTFVNFDILSETTATSAKVSRPQRGAQRRDIPSIAKDAQGAVVTIVMAKDDKPISLGTGFLVRPDGVIVTNYHVIASGNIAVVKFADGTTVPVDGVLASDKIRDLAVIKIHGKPFQTLPLGNSEQIQTGQDVVAIGNPLGLELSVSNGIVSGVRNDDQQGGKLLQITAPISHGSSGGPLFNLFGEVIGINSMFLEGGENLNFAIPINDAKRLLSSLPAPAKPGQFDVGFDVHALPNESQSAGADKPESETSPPASAPDLKTTVEFMKRMAEPEHRDVLDGVLEGAILHSSNGPALTIVSHQNMIMVFTTGVTHKNGYPEFTYSVVSDGDGQYEQKDYPRYMSFALGDIDPSSIEAKVGGYDPSALSDFWDKHPRCEANPECNHEFLGFLDSAPKLTAVQFHTTDLKPLIERGGCSVTSGCGLTETTGSVLILFKSKDRAERFVTALTYAVKSAGGKQDLFPPTHYSKKD